MLLWQIGHALRWLHQRGFAHLDVKPDNILICKRREAEGSRTDWLFKLTDFGLTARVADEAFGDGDCRYLPPLGVGESMERREMVTAATAQKADVFALGVSAIQLVGAREACEVAVSAQTDRVKGLLRADSVREDSVRVQSVAASAHAAASEGARGR